MRLLFSTLCFFVLLNAQIMRDVIVGDEEEDYDIPRWIVPQPPASARRENTYQRVVVVDERPSEIKQDPYVITRHFTDHSPATEEPTTTLLETSSNADPEILDQESIKGNAEEEKSWSLENIPDYVEPDNTIYPKPVPGVTVDQFIKVDSIKIELSECLPDKKIIERLLQDYHKHKTPSEEGVKVFIEVWLQDMTAVNERTADFEAEMYLSEIWIDHALNYEAMKPCRHNLTLSYDILDKIWKPNTVFINSKMAIIHRSPFPNIFILIYSNGTVWINERIQVKGPCPDMDFSSFPVK